MNLLFTEPMSMVLAITLATIAIASLTRAGTIISRSRPWPEAAPMLRPIRAWRLLIFGSSLLLGSAGFAFQLTWLVAFAAILAFVETMEASMMLQALGAEEQELTRAKPAPCESRSR